MKAATTISHHDSRTSRAKRGDSVVSAGAARATARARRRGGIASFLLKNISLRPILHAVHYTPGRRRRKRRGGRSDERLGRRTAPPHPLQFVDLQSEKT